LPLSPSAAPKTRTTTENLAGLLKKQGFRIERDPSQADALVVHTCSFIEAAKKESVHAILDAAKGKKTGAKLIVTGCLVQQHGKDILDEFPEVDAFLGTGQLAQVADVINKPRARFLDKSNPGGLVDPDARASEARKEPPPTFDFPRVAVTRVRFA